MLTLRTVSEVNELRPGTILNDAIALDDSWDISDWADAENVLATVLSLLLVALEKLKPEEMEDRKAIEDDNDVERVLESESLEDTARRSVLETYSE